MTVSRYVYWMLFTVMLIGLYAVISHGNLLKKLIGLTVFQVGSSCSPSASARSPEAARRSSRRASMPMPTRCHR